MTSPTEKNELSETSTQKNTLSIGSTIPNMENAGNKRARLAKNIVSRPAGSAKKTAGSIKKPFKQGTSSAVAIVVSGTKRKNAEENSTPPPPKTIEEREAGDKLTEKNPSKLSSSIKPPNKPRPSSKIKSVRKPLKRVRSIHSKKKSLASSIGAPSKRISLPSKRASNNEKETEGGVEDEENKLVNEGIDIPDSPTAKASSEENTEAGSSLGKKTAALVVASEDPHPYQHFGQLNPAWNIPPLKENEKPMKAFCSKFKVPGGNNANNNAGGEEIAPAERARGNATAEVENEDTQGEEEKDTRSGPLVEIIDGEIVIKQSSVIVVGGRQSTEEVDKELAADGAVVEEDSYTLTATYNSFTNRMKTQHWKLDDTRLFYSALRQCGTDFSTMELMYEGFDEPKTRKQLKSKYKRECKKNPKLIDMAMNPSAQIPLDLSVFGELEIEKVSASGATATKSVADSTASNKVKEGATPTKAASSGASPMESNSNDKVLDIDQVHVPTNSKLEPSEPVKVLGDEEGKYPTNKTGIALDGVVGQHSSIVADTASTAGVRPVVKKSEEPIVEESAAKPIALFGVKKKTVQRPKFRAKPRPKKSKAKRPAK